MVFSAKNKRQFGIRSHRNLFVALFLCLVFVSSGIVTLILNVNAQTVPVKSIEVNSQHTSYQNKEMGAWKVTKSAEWTDINKARVTFEVESIAEYDDSTKLDVILVIDNSGSMTGEKIAQVKTDAADLANVLLSGSDNKIALITFNDTARILSEFSNNKQQVVDLINNLDTPGCTNYYDGLLKAQEVLEGYEKEEGRELILLFLTDGFPNVQTPNEVAQYHVLKEMYPYMVVNGIQYEMGDEILQPIINISDNQFIANMSNLNNVLFDAAVIPYIYDDFRIVDYIDTDYWQLGDLNGDGYINEVDLTNAISSSIGSYGNGIEVDSSDWSIRWDISGKYHSGRKVTLTIDLLLKDEYLDNLDDNLLLPTNTHESITTSMDGVPDESVDSTDTPILKSAYDVIYEANTPDSCELADTVPATTSHTIFSTVAMSDNTLSCPGYDFKGWRMKKPGAVWINDDYFRMPGEDVYIEAIWGKPGISKSMDGTTHTRVTTTLAQGSIINSKLKKLSGQTNTGWTVVDDNITSIVRADELSIMVDTADDSYVISDPYSAEKIYAWYDNGVIYYFTTADEIYMNKDSSYMFSNLAKLTSVDGLTSWISSNVTQLNNLFYGTGSNASSFSFDLSGLDVSNVWNMSNMFGRAGYNASSFSLDLSGWDTSSLTDTYAMFIAAGYNASSWTITGLSDLNMSKVSEMSYMFYNIANNATNLALDFSGWDTANVTSMDNMFDHAGINAVSWTITGLSNWNTTKVTNMNNMFSYAGYSATSWSIDLTGWNTSNVTTMNNMFSYAGYSATNWSVDLTGWTPLKVTNMNNMFSYAGYSATSWSIDGLNNWNVSSLTVATKMFNYAAYNASNISLNLSSWKTSNLTDAANMFGYFAYNASSFYLDLSNWDVSNVVNMGGMFNRIGHEATTWSIVGLSGWKPSKATSFTYLFFEAGYNSSSFSLDLSGWDASSVTDMNNAFANTGYNSSSYSLNVSGWKTSSVTNIMSIFYYAGRSATTWSITGLSDWDTSNVTTMMWAFYCAAYNASSFSLDLSGWDTSNVENMGYLFSSAGRSATSWSITGLSGWNVSKVTNMNSILYAAGYNTNGFSLNLSGWNTPSVTDMGNAFYQAGYRARNFSLNLSGWDTSHVTNMSRLFAYTGTMATTSWSITGLSGWDTSNVENMSSMFSNAAYNARSFVFDLSEWDTSKVTNMNDMFTNGGRVATTWSVTIPATSSGIQNTASSFYGSSTSTYASPASGKSFTLATP